MYLITPSLLNSFAYYFSSEFETTETDEGVITTAAQKEAAARADFLRTLSRERSEPTPSMLKGINFEEKVRAYCEDRLPDADNTPAITEIGQVVYRGTWQETVSKVFEGYFLYGKVDVMKRDFMYDIKFTGSYDIGKFKESAQHRIYFLCTGLPNFAYLASNERDVWREDYSNHAGIGDEVANMIANFRGYLKNDKEACKLFEDKWVSYREAA